MISKTGYTTHCKNLIKILREKKPIKRGGGFFPSFLNSNTNNTNNSDNSDNKQK